MLQMTHIQKLYRTELVRTHALRELTLSATEGEFIAMTGPSGSGKTTFLNMQADIPQTIRLNGGEPLAARL